MKRKTHYGMRLGPDASPRRPPATAWQNTATQGGEVDMEDLLRRTNPAALDRWMLTHSGRRVWPAFLNAADVVLSDIATHLSRLCRFTGACREFYSVAQHSVLVLEIGRHRWPSLAPADLRALLLHDASEAYLGDMGSPLKADCADYRLIEDCAMSVIRARFGMTDEPSTRDIVKQADLIALATERRDLLPPSAPWPALAGVDPLDIAHGRVVPLAMDAARDQFLAAWDSISV